jgi:HTH-type transcriptional regulator/antitoxin HipB
MENILQDVEQFRDLKALGSLLRRHRERRGLSQRELASMSGVDAKQISRIETAAHEAKITTILRVAAALGLDLAITYRSGPSSRVEDIF